MGYIDKIKLPDNKTYDIKHTIIPVVGTQTAATGSWTGNIDIDSLYDGLTIAYFLPYNSSGNATLNLTLKDGTTTGAINCYYNSSRLTTHYAKGNNIIMTYWSAGSIKIDGTATTDNRWVAQADYNSDSTGYYLRRIYSNLKAGTNKIFPFTMIMQNADGRWESLVTSSTVNSTKTRNTHGFRLGQVLLMYANVTYNADELVGTYNIWTMHSGLIDHRYSFNTENNTTKGTTGYKPVYLVGIINNSDGLFYLDETWWTQTLPSTDNGKVYIYIGDAYDYYRMTFVDTQKFYKYTNGALREISQDTITVNGHTINKDVPSNAVFTDTNYYHTTGSWSGLTYTATNHGGASALAFTIPTGTTSTTVAKGDHTHSSLIVKDQKDVDYVAPTTAKMLEASLTRLNKVGINTSLSKGGVILTGRWASGNYDTQLFIGMGDHNHMYLRGNNGSSYTAWKTIFDSDNFSVSLAADSGTSTVNLAHNTTYKLTAGGKSVIFKTPIDNNTTYSAGTGISLSDTTFSINNSEISPYEANLQWGGKNFSGSYGCIDAAMVNELGANRLMFLKAEGITIEYSRDDGATWIDYGATDSQKVALFSNGGYNFIIGKADSTNKATANGTKYQLRVTLATGAAKIYTELHKFVIYLSTSGSNSCTVTIQKALESTPTNFSDIATNISISGWSGYNVINVSPFITYGNTPSTQYGRIRFVFKANGGNTNYTGLYVSKIMGFGGVGWNTPSTMAKTGHLYSFDQLQNATFPASITATSFNGNATSATSATNASNLVGFKITTTTNLDIDGTDVNQAIGYVGGLTKANWNYQQVDGALYRQVYSASWIHQIFGDYRTGQISVRGRNNGNWQSWRRILDETNYSSIITGYATSGHNHDGTYAPASHGTHVPDYCTTITDWNNATTNGWYMGSSASNAPTTAWYMGRVVAHNDKYTYQEIWQFTGGSNSGALNKTHYIRFRYNSTWGSWVNISVRNDTSVGTIGWVSDSSADNTRLVNINDIAYWNGAYNGTSSNLAYCNKGAFGSVVTHNHTEYALSDHTHNYAGSPSAGGPANKVYAKYTLNGGKQPPSYYGTNAAGFLMSNASVAGNTHFKNWLYMDCYNANDVGGATAIGVDRLKPRMFIMQSDANRTTWNNTAAVGVFTVTPTSGQVVVTDETDGGIKSSGYTIATSVPSNAVFTDTKVTQTLRTADNNYPILLSTYDNNYTTSSVTNSVYRNNSVYVNTSVGSLHSNEVCTTKYRVSQYPNAVAMQVLAAGESALVEDEALHIGVTGLPTILRGSVSLVDGDLFFNMKPAGVSEQGEVIYGDESQGLIFKGYRGLYYDESVTPAIKVGNSALCLNLLGDGIYTNTDLNFARHTYTSSDTTTYGIILDGNMALKVGENDTVDFGIITKDMVLYSTAISADCDVTFSQTLYLSNTSDVAAATYNHPALVIGERDPSDHTMSQHMEFDSNEIMVKTNDSTAGILYLQDESGSIQMGCGHIIIGKGTVTNTNIVICGKTYKTNTFADTNPKIIFKNTDQSQNVSLTFTDFNDVGDNASITLNGNQGGEYFIAPYIKATSGWINPSDRRLKRNIQSLDSRYLDLIKNLNPVSFNFKDEKSDTKTHAGFIAQEVQEAIEKAGLDNEDIAAIIKPYTEEGYYELSYTEFIPMLLLYIKDLEKQIKEIKEKEKY